MHADDLQASYILAGDGRRPAEVSVSAVVRILRRFNLVGFTDELDHFLTQLSVLWGTLPRQESLDGAGKLLAAGHVNAKKTETQMGVSYADAYTEQSTRVIREHTQVDAAVYRELRARPQNTAAAGLPCTL